MFLISQALSVVPIYIIKMYSVNTYPFVKHHNSYPRFSPALQFWYLLYPKTHLFTLLPAYIDFSKISFSIWFLQSIPSAMVL